MLAHHSSVSSYPHQRLSLFTHSTLGRDIAEALKASTSSTHARKASETPAPPPSPVDFAFTPDIPDGEMLEEWRLDGSACNNNATAVGA